MRVNSVTKYISITAFALLFCPANIFLLVPYIAICALFVKKLSDDPSFAKCTPDKKSILLSFCLDLIILFIFIFRWSNRIGVFPAVITGLVLALAASLCIPVILQVYTPSKQQSSAFDTKLTLSEHLIALLSGFIIITAVSSASPIVAINGINDSNCLLTVGRGLLRGKIVYRDLMEQKGPILYLINAVAALITPYGFTGVWITESIACYIFIVIAAKIQRLLRPSGKRMPIIICGAMTFLVYSCYCFAYGNTAEEFSIPCIAAILFLCTRCILSDNIDFKSTFIAGCLTAFVFWIKFTLCGAVVGIAIFLTVYLIRRKDLKSLFRAVTGVIAGFMAVSAAVILFFALNHASRELFDVYFYQNIFKYNMGGDAEDPLYKVLSPLLMLFMYSADNFHLALLFLIGQFVLLRKNKHVASMIITSFITCFIFAFIGSKTYPYYAFILTPFTLFSWSAIADLIEDRLKAGSKAVRHIILVAVALIICGTSITEARNREHYGIPKEDFPSYNLSQIIMQDDDRSMVCYGFLDRGFYTYTGTDPDMLYFTYLNADSEHILMEQQAYIASGRYKYVITEYTPQNFQGYELIATDKSPTEDIDYYLYRRIDN